MNINDQIFATLCAAHSKHPHYFVAVSASVVSLCVNCCELHLSRELLFGVSCCIPPSNVPLHCSVTGQRHLASCEYLRVAIFYR